MGRNPQQVAQLIQTLMRLTKGKMSMRWTLLLGALLVGYLFAQPYLERTLGVDLPGFPDAAETAQRDRQSSETGRQSGTRKQDGSGPTSKQRPQASGTAKKAPESADDFAKLAARLKDRGQGVYETPAGLRYTRGSQHGHRLKHLMAHAKDDPDRPGQHGVFETSEPAEVLALVDEAYKQALAGNRTKTKHEGERTVYEVNMGRKVGYIGGQSGNRRSRPSANYIRMVVQGKNLITAFPVRL